MACARWRTGDVGERALQAEAEAGVRTVRSGAGRGTSHSFLFFTFNSSSGIEDGKPLSALAAADDLAIPGASTSIAATVRPSSFTACRRP